MLKLKDLVEDFDLAKEILSNWEYDADTVDQCLECFRISSNAVYPFRQKGRLCFLRFAPTTEKQRANLEGELEFIFYLKKNGYPALTPIQARNSEYLLTLNTAWGSFYAMAFFAVPGDSIEDSDFSEEVCREYGKTLGRLHKLSCEFVPQVRKQTHEDLLDLIEKRLNDFHCDKALLDCLASLRAELSALPKDKWHYGLVHYDFECDNVFFDEETKSCHVIDFDDGIYHFYALDIEQALDSIDEEAPEEAQSSARAAFMAGYRSEFSCDETVEASFPIMRRFCDLYAYTKLIYCLSESVPEEPDWMIQLKKKLTGKAEYLKHKLTAGEE